NLSGDHLLGDSYLTWAGLGKALMHFQSPWVTNGSAPRSTHRSRRHLCGSERSRLLAFDHLQDGRAQLFVALQGSDNGRAQLVPSLRERQELAAGPLVFFPCLLRELGRHIDVVLAKQALHVGVKLLDRLVDLSQLLP